MSPAVKSVTDVFDVYGTKLWGSSYFLFKILLIYKDWRQTHLVRCMYRWEDTKRLTMILFAVIIVIFIDMDKTLSDVSERLEMLTEF
jgi:hypothetical protein